MTLPASGAISLNDIQTEFGGTNPISISEYYGAASGVPASGAISLSDFYGKSSAFYWNYTIPNGTVNFNLRSAAVAAGWNGSIRLIANLTIATGSVVGASSPSYYGFDTDAGFPAGTAITLTIQSGAYLFGASGAGGAGGPSGGSVANGSPGGYGMHAMVVRYPMTIYNYGSILGGGGGGGGGGNGWHPSYGYVTGGQGGGGQGYYAGGPNGAWNNVGAGGNPFLGYSGAGGNGGGVGGYGATGATGYTYDNGCFQISGGAGGAGGAPGYCLVGNQYVTWGATGSRYGTIANI